MKIISLYIFTSFLLSTSFDTRWGECTINNLGTSIDNQELMLTINSNINDLNTIYGIVPHQKIHITIANTDLSYINHNHWKWSLGIAYKNPDRIIIKDPAFAKISKRKFNQVLKHELSHVMMNRFNTIQSIPRWFKEGFAMNEANEISLNHKILVAQNLRKENLFNINHYNSFKNFNRSEFNLAYAISGISIIALKKMYGDNIINEIIYNLKNNIDFENAFLNSANQSLDQFNNNFYTFINKQYFWFKLINLPQNIFVLMPLLLVIGFYIKSMNNKKIKRQWEIEEQLEDLD